MKKMVISKEFFNKLINEKVEDNKQFQIEYYFSTGELRNLHFKTDGYFTSFYETHEGITRIEREKDLETGEYKIVNTKTIEHAIFHPNSLRTIEQILEDLCNEYACIDKKEVDDILTYGATVYYTFLKK
jgi:hypothetical protein